MLNFPWFELRTKDLHQNETTCKPKETTYKKQNNRKGEKKITCFCGLNKEIVRGATSEEGCGSWEREIGEISAIEGGEWERRNG